MKRLFFFFFLIFILPTLSLAAPAIQILPVTNGVHTSFSNEKIRTLVQKFVDVDAVRAVRVQPIGKTSETPAHLVVHLHALNSHRVDFISLTLDDKVDVIAVQENYKLTLQDQAQQPGSVTNAVCPDSAAQFIAFAPNQDDFEIQITKDVAAAAQAKNLNTVELLVKDATRQNYFNYLSCPNIIGNFYDGDANPNVIVTSDGVIEAAELAHFHFRHHVTHMWLACQAFNDPLLTTMISTTQSQKYAAGINDLLIGPSDNTAKCAMIAALNSQPMTAAFQACYQTYDKPEDHWGFGGEGSDLFGQ